MQAGVSVHDFHPLNVINFDDMRVLVGRYDRAKSGRGSIFHLADLVARPRSVGHELVRGRTKATKISGS